MTESRVTRSLLGALLLVAGTGSLGAQSPAPVAQDTMPERVVRAYVSAYNAHDVEATVAFLTPDFVWLSIVGDSVTADARGVDDIRNGLTAYFRRLASARSEIEQITVLGPWVAVKERAHWADTRGPRSQAALSVYEVRGGKLRRVWYYPVVTDAPEGG